MKQFKDKLFQHDKLKHFFTGFFLYIFLSLFFGHLVALAITSLVAIGKEVIWDRYLGKGMFEWLDAVYTIVPGLFISILIIIKVIA